MDRGCYFCPDVLVKLGMAFRELQNHLKQKKSLNNCQKISKKLRMTRHRTKTQGFRAAGQSHVQRSFISKGLSPTSSGLGWWVFQKCCLCKSHHPWVVLGLMNIRFSMGGKDPPTWLKKGPEQVNWFNQLSYFFFSAVDFRISAMSINSLAAFLMEI